jgi:hypothetical protein
MEPAADARAGRAITRWAALGGAIYVVLFVIGTIFMFSGAPQGDDPPAKFVQWFSDSGHRDRVHVGWILMGLSIFFLLWFIAALRRVVASLDTDGLLTTVVAIGGTVYAATTIVAISVSDGIRTMSDDTYRHQVFPPLIHAADDAAWVIHATGAVGLSAMIIAASLAFMWRGVWPNWAGWLGVVAGILSLFSVVFFPQFLFLLWILIVSVLLFMRPARYTAARAA